MKENYADTLESYLIPAEEGFVGTTLKVLGISVLTLTAMPFVLIGGVLWVSGAHIKRETKKFDKELKKQAKANNGKIVDYEDKSKSIFSYYAKDITKIEEPVYFQRLIPVFKQALLFSKEADAIRKEYAQILKKDPYDKQNCEKILKKFTALSKKIKDYYNSNKELYQSDSSAEKRIIDLNHSTLMQLKEIEEANSKILYFNETSIPEDWVLKYIWYDDKYWDAYDDASYDTSLDNEIRGTFGEIYYDIQSLTNWEDLIEFCRFALNPKIKSKY